MHSRKVWSIFVVLALVNFYESKPITIEGNLSGPAPTGNPNASTAVGNIDGIQIGMAILKAPDSALRRPKTSSGGLLTEVWCC